MSKPKVVPGLPSRDQILRFIEESDQPAGKREIARAFGLKGNEKIQLKALLKDMADEGLIDGGPGRAFHKMGGVPKVTVLRVIDVDDGQVIATPEHWVAEGLPAPRLRVMERRGRGIAALGVGDRILARTEEAGKGWVAHPMKKLARGEELVLGVVHKEGDRLWLKPVDKRERHDLPISDVGEADVGDLVLAEKAGRPPKIMARVTEILGDPFAPRSFSLIAIHKFGIPDIFSEAALEEADRSAKQPLGEGREDLRHLPIVAIDPADARDHDDAIWAAQDDHPGNEGGWQAIVAIADVSFYVRPGTALDREARKRGNSVYFPDRVVPMLPEILSADVCSLGEGADRAAMACHLTIDAKGEIKAFRFARAVVRIAAVIAYEDAQAAIDSVSSPASNTPFVLSEVEGRAASESPEARTSTSLSANGPILDALKNLWSAWSLLKAARDRREPLALDLPEQRVMLDEKGRIASVSARERLDAHQVVEDFMIAANVAAAKALEKKQAPVMYRIHETPSREKLVALKDYLATFDVSLALGQVVRPKTFNHILDLIEDRLERPEIMTQVLRTQMQAVYSPNNVGHFGLALGSYAHFTSPIRRYADLLVHRALVGAYLLDPAAEETRLSSHDTNHMEELGEKISQAERRAMEAERETIDRYIAAYLSTKVGELVETRITGVQRFGFFATVEGLGGDGLVPVSTLGAERFHHDEATHSLIGEESGERYHVGQRLTLRLVEANVASGALRFELAEGANHMPGRRLIRRDGRRPVGKRGRPANIRHQGRR
ncbi:RNB domain-containing ribonuclease [Sphingomonas sp. CGMCC 1.13654]|uniref:Ribonuclease R n=1 Tax=Sphingomonas chungangi TaxID=2683589 RepID=A0A838LFN3_9SPHN|nr:RNB domain-containing ribonuclease [Sphingomonas chungangi]MBA2936238.1 RNB domain-containing ribonuclease [Sphingomonas chungangi]MVW55623.1 RNB domain-containing ribonuclease [Sphingomonas chungangi]